MKTDSFFWQLLKHLPETLFALLEQPLATARAYQFEAVEMKKSFRLDGLFVPKRSGLPLYFVEVQFQRRRKFYVNLFAKVYSYLNANEPDQDWVAVAIFPDRSIEPKRNRACQALLDSRHVKRVYLDELIVSGSAPAGLMILQLVTSEESKTGDIVTRLRDRMRHEPDCEKAAVIIELIEEILMRRFTELNREELRRMFKLNDIRKSRVWQEAHGEGLEQGIEQGLEQGIEQGLEKGLEQGLEKGLEQGLEKGKLLEKQNNIKRLHAKGKSLKEIAELLDIPLAEVRRLSR